MSQINEYLVTAKCENAFTHKQSIVEMPAEHETCHSTCQRYMRYKLTKLLESKQRAKAIDEVGFWRDVGKNLRKKSERKAK